MSSSDSLKKRGLFARFFGLLWHSIKALYTLVIGLFSVFVMVAIVYGIVGQRGPEIPTGVALALNPAGTLVEQETMLSATALLQGNDLPQQALVKDLIDALALARDDSRIALVVLELDKLGSGLLPELESNVELVLWETSEQGRLDASSVAKLSGDLKDKHVLYCGPSALRDSLRKELPKHGLSARRFHYELFEIRTGVGLQLLFDYLLKRAKKYQHNGAGRLGVYTPWLQTGAMSQLEYRPAGKTPAGQQQGYSELYRFLFSLPLTT